MKFLELLGEIVIVYVLYKVIFDFMVPAYKAVKQVKSAMNGVHTRMQEQQPKKNNTPSQSPIKKTNPIIKDDYIDYEEVK